VVLLEMGDQAARAGCPGRNSEQTFLLEGEPAGEHGEIFGATTIPVGKKRLRGHVPGRGLRIAKVDAGHDRHVIRPVRELLVSILADAQKARVVRSDLNIECALDASKNAP